MLDSFWNKLNQIDIIRWNLIALITTKFTPPASSKHKNTNKFITTKYTPPLNRLASSRPDMFYRLSAAQSEYICSFFQQGILH
jgi:hypothetical protein